MTYHTLKFVCVSRLLILRVRVSENVRPCFARAPVRVPQEMSEDPSTPKEEKQERLSRHKETVQRSQAEEEAYLLTQQRLVYDKSCRSLKRRTLVRRHEFEQEQMREVKE